MTKLEEHVDVITERIARKLAKKAGHDESEWEKYLVEAYQQHFELDKVRWSSDISGGSDES